MKELLLGLDLLVLEPVEVFFLDFVENSREVKVDLLFVKVVICLLSLSCALQLNVLVLQVIFDVLSIHIFVGRGEFGQLTFISDHLEG